MILHVYNILYIQYTYLPMLLIFFVDALKVCTKWLADDNSFTFLGQFPPKLIFSLGFFRVVDGVGGRVVQVGST